jgi:hypothetical protein
VRLFRTRVLAGRIDAITQGGYGRLVTAYRTSESPREMNQQLLRGVPAGDDLSVVSTLRLSAPVIKSSWDCQNSGVRGGGQRAVGRSRQGAGAARFAIGIARYSRLPKCRTGTRARGATNLSASAAPRVIGFAYSSGD